jgi:2-amino-4-hydroxy-6-hydroxymethyldihydropteridine diphosphokinase
VTVLAAIALGANMGPREQTLALALELLDAHAPLNILSVSSLHESPPWGDADQPDFLNAVMVGELTGSAEDLFAHLKTCEQRLGKQTLRRWGPRVIDLDLLAVGEIVRTGELELPHPRMAGRPFVYLPLREACDGLTLPDAWQVHLVSNAEGRALESVTRRRAPDGVFPSRPVRRRWAVTLASLDETEQLARAFGQGCRPGEVLALSGPLGVGKSVFVRALARELGVTGPMPSPTFTLCREYRGGRLSLQHWDFYRLESEDDLESAGFPPAKGEFDVLAVEWAEKFPDALKDGRVSGIALETVPGHDDARRLHVEFAAGTVALRSLLGQKAQGGKSPC